MFHEDFCRRFAREWQPSRQELIQDDAQCIDIDLRTILAPRDFGSHVIDGPHTLGVLPPMITIELFREPHVTNFDGPILAIDVRWLEITVYDPPVVQIGNSGHHSPQPVTNLV